MMNKSALISIVFISNAIIQLINQVVVTRLFGAKLNLDIFLAAVALPTLFVTTIYSTLNDAFLPLYGEKKAKSSETSNHYFITHILFLVFASLVVTILFIIFSLPISQFLYKNRGAEFVQSVSFQMNLMFFSFPLAIIATLFGAYYYSHKKFTRFPVAQAIGNLTNLLMIIILSPLIGIWSMIFAFVLNIIFQISIVIPPFKLFHHLKTFLVPPKLYAKGEKLYELRQLLYIWIPLIIGYSAFRSESVFVRSFASSLPTGYLVYLNLVTKMYTLATGVMTIGIQILLLPHLVEYFTDKKTYQKGINMINKAKISAISVSIMIGILVMLIAPIMIKILFVGGKFNQNDANIASALLPMFFLPAIGWGIYGVFFQPLLALKKHPVLSLLCVVSLLLGWSTATLLKTYSPLYAISLGLIVMLLSGIIGSELLWQYYKKKILKF